MADPAFQQTVEMLSDAVSKNPGAETAVVTEAMRHDSRICGLFDPNSPWNAYFKQRIEFYRALHSFQQQAALPPPPPPPPTSIASFKEMLSQHTHDLSRYATNLNLGDTEGSNLVTACLNLLQELKEHTVQEFDKLYNLVRQLVELSSHELNIPGLFSVRRAMAFQAPAVLSALMVQAAQVDPSCKSKVLELVKLATLLQVIPQDKKVQVQQQVVAASLPILSSRLTPTSPVVNTENKVVPPIGHPIDHFSVGEMVTLLKREYKKNRTSFMPYTPIDSKGAFERAPTKEPLTINVARRIEDLYLSLGENHSVPFNRQAPDQFEEEDNFGRNSKRYRQRSSSTDSSESDDSPINRRGRPSWSSETSTFPSGNFFEEETRLGLGATGNDDPFENYRKQRANKYHQTLAQVQAERIRGTEQACFICQLPGHQAKDCKFGLT